MSRIFVKQYGLQRTGTNPVRALLDTYVPDVTVLMHVLGDKHSPPVDLQSVLRFAECRANPALTFVTMASLLSPAETTRLGQCARQRAYLQAVAGELYEQVRGEGLRVVLSVRDPCGWVRAAMRWRSWMPAYRRAAAVEPVAVLTAMCEEYNRASRTWSDLLAVTPAAAVVRHEELQGDLDLLLARLVRELELPSVPTHGVSLPHITGEADWDQEPTPFIAEHAARRARRDDDASLAAELTAVLRRRIDWGVAGAWGYAAPVD
jgi:hypothetical protein